MKGRHASVAKTLEELSGQELTSLSAQELIDALGGLGEMAIRKDGFYTTEFAEAVKQQPTFPLMIPTPDNYRGTAPFTVSMQVNGMTVTIEADQLTLVPQVFYEVWMNKVQGEALLRQHRRVAAQRMNYINSRTELPDY